MTEPETDLSTQLILARFDKQDAALDTITREVRRTNGRVTALEQRNAVTDGKAEVTQSAQTQRRDHWRFLGQGVYVLLGGVLGIVGHLLGAW